jgi:hypothetical protein
MKHRWPGAAIVVSMLVVSGQLCQAAVQSPSPQSTSLAQSVDPRIVAKAKELFHSFQTGQVDRSQFDAASQAQLSDAMIEREAKTLQPFGNPSSFQFLRTYAIANTIGYDFLLEFSAGRIVEMIAFDPDGKIAGIDFMTFTKN